MQRLRDATGKCVWQRKQYDCRVWVSSGRRVPRYYQSRKKHSLNILLSIEATRRRAKRRREYFQCISSWNETRKRIISSIDLSKQVLSGENRCIISMQREARKGNGSTTPKSFNPESMASERERLQRLIVLDRPLSSIWFKFPYIASSLSLPFIVRITTDKTNTEYVQLLLNFQRFPLGKESTFTGISKSSF